MSVGSPELQLGIRRFSLCLVCVSGLMRSFRSNFRGKWSQIDRNRQRSRPAAIRNRLLVDSLRCPVLKSYRSVHILFQVLHSTDNPSSAVLVLLRRSFLFFFFSFLLFQHFLLVRLFVVHLLVEVITLKLAASVPIRPNKLQLPKHFKVHPQFRGEMKSAVCC